MQGWLHIPLAHINGMWPSSIILMTPVLSTRIPVGEVGVGDVSQLNQRL